MKTSDFTINLILPIRIKPTFENGGYVITDATNSEYFFYEDKTTGELVYDGCCVSVENKHILFNQIVIDEMNKKSK